MQVILIIVPVVSLIFAAISGKMGDTSSAILAKSGEAVELVVSLCGIICFWSGMMRVAERAGLTENLAKLLSPIVGLLFKGIKRGGKAAGLITMNLAANVLGLGNASTPLGIAAMRAIAEESADFDGSAATDDMILLAVLNASSLQIIPATAAALRVSIYSVVVATVSAKLMCRIRRKT